MSSILVVAEKIESGKELLALARTWGKSVFAAAMDENMAGLMAQAGAERSFWLKSENPWPESRAAALAGLMDELGCKVLLVQSSVRGRDIAARVAAICKCGLACDVTGISLVDGGVETKRLMYGGAVVAAETIEGTAIITVPAGRFPVSEQTLAPGSVSVIEAAADTRVSVLDTRPAQRQGADLGSARSVVCAGLGFEKREDLAMAEELCGHLNAALGCTRPLAEDRGWLPAETYIGISGASVRPDLYIGLGVSGQVQHTVGIRDSKVVVAINSNEKAPIFQVADYGLAGDLYEILPLLNKKLGEARG